MDDNYDEELVGAPPNVKGTGHRLFLRTSHLGTIGRFSRELRLIDPHHTCEMPDPTESAFT